MKRDDPKIDTAQTPKRFDRRLALQENIQRLLLLVSQTIGGLTRLNIVKTGEVGINLLM